MIVPIGSRAINVFAAVCLLSACLPSFDVVEDSVGGTSSIGRTTHPTESCADSENIVCQTGTGPMCVNAQVDPNNCGDCGVVCATGTICSGGKCVNNDGGTSSDGGTTGSGGSTAKGKTTTKGGTSNFGDTTPTGGVPTGSGGSTTKGGTSNIGGFTPAGGGATASGGTATKGGTTTKGGTATRGGATGSGGTATKGGTTSLGGAAATGGTASSSVGSVLDDFEGTWTRVSGTGAVSVFSASGASNCSGASGPQIFSNELVIARGVDSDLAMTGATCSLKLALSSNTAKASTGQSCSMTNPDGNEISRILDIEIVLNANRTVADVTWKIESVRSLTPAAVTCEFTGISFTYQKQ